MLERFVERSGIHEKPSCDSRTEANKQYKVEDVYYCADSHDSSESVRLYWEQSRKASRAHSQSKPSPCEASIHSAKRIKARRTLWALTAAIDPWGWFLCLCLLDPHLRCVYGYAASDVRSASPGPSSCLRGPHGSHLSLLMHGSVRWLHYFLLDFLVFGDPSKPGEYDVVCPCLLSNLQSSDTDVVSDWV